MPPSRTRRVQRDADLVGDAIGRIVRRANLPRLHEQLALEAGVRVDRAGFQILTRINDTGGLRLSELAERHGTDVSTVSRQVAALERLGLIARTPDPSDRRAAIVSLTEAGRDVHRRLRAARRGVIAEVLAEWPPEDRDRLADLLSRFADDYLARVGELR